MDAYGSPGAVRYWTPFGADNMLLSGSMMSKPEVLLKEEEEELGPVEEERSCRDCKGSQGKEAEHNVVGLT